MKSMIREEKKLHLFIDIWLKLRKHFFLQQENLTFLVCILLRRYQAMALEHLFFKKQNIVHLAHVH